MLVLVPTVEGKFLCYFLGRSTQARTQGGGFEGIRTNPIFFARRLWAVPIATSALVNVRVCTCLLLMPIVHAYCFTRVGNCHDHCTAYFSRSPQARDCSTYASSETGSFCSRKRTASSSSGHSKSKSPKRDAELIE